MHKAYGEFKQLVEAEKLSVTYIDAAPRTVSAAFFRSLTHVHDASGYEPFNHGANFESSMQFLLGQARKAGVHNASASQPTTLVVKGPTRGLPVEDWANWMPLVKNFVVIVRDPHVQLQSQIRRFANDVFYNPQGAEGFKETQVRSMAEQAENILERSGTIGKLPLSNNFNRTSWQDLQTRSIALDSHLNDQPQKQLMIIDGFLLQADPESIMSEVLTRLKITFDTTILARVVSQWSPETVQSGDSSELAPRLPCKGKSVRNRGVSQRMPFLLIPRSLLRGGFITSRMEQTNGPGLPRQVCPHNWL